MEDVSEVDEHCDFVRCRLNGLDLMLKALDCENFKPTFEKYGIDENLMLLLTSSDLRHMGFEEKDISKIEKSLATLNNGYNKVHLSKEDVANLQSNIIGQIGKIVLLINHIHFSITQNKNNFEDLLIDNYLSSINAAFMLRPYMAEEEKSIEKTIKKVYKIKEKRTIVVLMTTVCTVFVCGLAFKKLNYSFNSLSNIFTNPNLISQVKIWIN